MTQATAQDHVIDNLQSAITHDLFNVNSHVKLAPVEGRVLKALQAEAVYKAHYEFVVDDVALSAFNGYHDIV